MSPQFLSPEQILDLHRAVVKRTGGNAGLRDYALLESAALAPQEARFGEFINKTIRSQAATYWLSVALNRPFFEANELTGLVVCEAFLQMNGYMLDMTQEQIDEVLHRFSLRGFMTKERLLQSLRVRPS